MEPGEEVFENTFEPACVNRRLTVDEIIEGMKFGAFDYKYLPAEVRDAVDRAIEHERALAAKRKVHDPGHDNMRELDLLDVGLELVRSDTTASSNARQDMKAYNIVKKSPVRPDIVTEPLVPERRTLHVNSIFAAVLRFDVYAHQPKKGLELAIL